MKIQIGNGKSGFRLHLVLTTLVTTLCFLFIVSAAMFAPLMARMDVNRVSLEAAGEIAAQVLYLHETFWPVVLASLCGVAASALYLHSRFTAPLVRFVRAFEEISAGRTPGAIRIRKSDFLNDETASFNNMLLALCTRVADIREREACVRDSIRALASNAAGGELSEQIADIEARQKSLAEEIARLGLDESSQTKRTE